MSLTKKQKKIYCILGGVIVVVVAVYYFFPSIKAKVQELITSLTKKNNQPLTT
jgi:hypothetical protein